MTKLQVKTLRDILDLFGGDCAEWVEQGLVNGKKTSKKKLINQVLKDIKDWHLSKQLTEGEIRRIIRGNISYTTFMHKGKLKAKIRGYGKSAHNIKQAMDDK